MVEKLQADSAPNTEQGEESNAPKYVTTEQVNSAITARSKKLEENNRILLEEVKQMKEMFMTLQQSKEVETPLPKKVEPEVVQKLQEQVAKMAKENEKVQQEKQAEVSKRMEQEKRQTVRDLLIANDIRPETVKFAMSHLIDSEKLISYDSDGQLVFNGANGESDLESGIKSWTNSEDGKLFRPSKGIKGSGDKSYKATRPGDKVNLEEEKEKLAIALRNLMSGQS